MNRRDISESVHPHIRGPLLSWKDVCDWLAQGLWNGILALRHNTVTPVLDAQLSSVLRQKEVPDSAYVRQHHMV